MKKKAAAKKNTKKLQLSRDTLRELASTDIPKVKAGYIIREFSGDTANGGCSGCV